jgi:hypothetical protein
MLEVWGSQIRNEIPLSSEPREFSPAHFTSHAPIENNAFLEIATYHHHHHIFHSI